MSAGELRVLPRPMSESVPDHDGNDAAARILGWDGAIALPEKLCRAQILTPSEARRLEDFLTESPDEQATMLAESGAQVAEMLVKVVMADPLELEEAQYVITLIDRIVVGTSECDCHNTYV
jgi:hypothetical protein